MKYILTFTNSSYCYDSAYSLTFDSQEKAILTADSLVKNFCNKSIMSELNDMQMEASYTEDGQLKENPAFNNKFTIPLYFVNLILKQYHMTLNTNL